MYINMLVEDYIQRIISEDIKPSIAWAMIKAIYEERTDEDESVWVYISAATLTSPTTAELKRWGSGFEVVSTDTIQTLTKKFEHAIYEQMDE